MILGRELLTALGMDFKFFDNVIIGGERLYEWCSTTMFEVRNYYFKSITDKTVKPEESFINSYIEEEFESGNAIKPTHRMRRILDANYEKSDLNEVMNKQCQNT